MARSFARVTVHNVNVQHLIATLLAYDPPAEEAAQVAELLTATSLLDRADPVETPEPAWTYRPIGRDSCP